MCAEVITWSNQTLLWSIRQLHNTCCSLNNPAQWESDHFLTGFIQSRKKGHVYLILSAISRSNHRILLIRTIIFFLLSLYLPFFCLSRIVGRLFFVQLDFSVAVLVLFPSSIKLENPSFKVVSKQHSSEKQVCIPESKYIMKHSYFGGEKCKKRIKITFYTLIFVLFRFCLRWRYKPNLIAC